MAAKYGNLKVVQMLIRRGTNPNLEGKNGLTPLHVATHYNRINVALYLLEKNASSHSATKVQFSFRHFHDKTTGRIHCAVYSTLRLFVD